jgi:hypothetical protein
LSIPADERRRIGQFAQRGVFCAMFVEDLHAP